jgi:hypothetical protein
VRGIWVIPVVLLFFVVAVAEWTAAGDRIDFSNPAATYEIGVIIDGARSGSDVNDEVETVAPGSDLTVTNLEAGTNNEIVVFQRERMVTVQSAPWTSGDDEITVSQSGEQGIAVAIWYLKVAFNRSVAACARMAQIWHDECMGLKLSSVEFHQEAVGKIADRLLSFDCSGPGCSEGADLLAALEAASAPPVDGMLNLYYVDTVNFGSGSSGSNGVWCGNNTIVLGSTAKPDLMVHETGHAFALDHTDGRAGFSATNVMWSVSTTRAYFTEGQTFRAHLDEDSAINATYVLRGTSATTRTCGDFGGGSGCVDLGLRIWADAP